MSSVTMPRVQPSDVLGSAAFAVGVAVLAGFVSVPGSVGNFTAGVALMILGIATVFGKQTFLKVFGKVLGTGKSDEKK